MLHSGLLDYWDQLIAHEQVPTIPTVVPDSWTFEPQQLYSNFFVIFLACLWGFSRAGFLYGGEAV